jgi:hypothetical protein
VMMLVLVQLSSLKYRNISKIIEIIDGLESNHFVAVVQVYGVALIVDLDILNSIKLK